MAPIRPILVVMTATLTGFTTAAPRYIPVEACETSSVHSGPGWHFPHPCVPAVSHSTTTAVTAVETEVQMVPRHWGKPAPGVEYSGMSSIASALSETSVSSKTSPRNLQITGAGGLARTHDTSTAKRLDTRADMTIYNIPTLTITADVDALALSSPTQLSPRREEHFKDSVDFANFHHKLIHDPVSTGTKSLDARNYTEVELAEDRKVIQKPETITYTSWVDYRNYTTTGTTTTTTTAFVTASAAVSPKLPQLPGYKVDLTPGRGIIQKPEMITYTSWVDYRNYTLTGTTTTTTTAFVTPTPSTDLAAGTSTAANSTAELPAGLGPRKVPVFKTHVLALGPGPILASSMPDAVSTGMDA